MALLTQSFYPRLGENALSFVIRPPAYLATGQTFPLAVGTFARYLGPTAGAAQKVATQTWLSVANGATVLLLGAHFLSDPLARQTIAAGTWTVGFGAQLANAAADRRWRGYASLHVIDGGRGTVRGTIFRGQIGTLRTETGEITQRAAFMGVLAEVFGGDILALELGIEVENTSGAAFTPQASLYADGADPILANAASATSARAFLDAPAALRYSLPQLGEPPKPTFDFRRAVEEVRGLLPGNSPHNFDKPGSTDRQFLDWHAQVLKSYLWDLLDLVQRELDPARARAKLRDWAGLYRIPLYSNIEQLRAVIFARLREFGPSNLYNTAASLGTLLGYRRPSDLEILEISGAQLRTALELVVETAQAIPLAGGFPAAFSSRTRFTRDGGAVWGIGAILTLELSQEGGTALHVRLTSPDGRSKVWSPVTRLDPQQVITLRAPELAGASPHGKWRLEIYRSGNPPLTLTRWRVYAPGAPAPSVGPPAPQPLPVGNPPVWPTRAPNVIRQTGLARWKFWWGVFVDPALVSAVAPADLTSAREALARLRHAYQKADVVLTKAPIPDLPASLPDCMVPS